MTALAFQTETKLFAHYFTLRNGHKTLAITKDYPDLDRGYESYTVSGKVEARKIAAKHGAQCWNF